MKFKTGEVLIYPHHGAGVVEDIIEIEVLGQMREYYVISFPESRTRVNVPTDNAAGSGLRRPVEPGELDKIYDHFFAEPDIDDNETWSKRNKACVDKLKSGSIYDAVEVYKYFRLREEMRGLSAVDVKIYKEAANAVLSELSHVENKSRRDIAAKIDTVFAKIVK